MVAEACDTGPLSYAQPTKQNIECTQDFTGCIDRYNLHPVGRLAGELYTHEHDIFAMKRPVENYAG